MKRLVTAILLAIFVSACVTTTAIDARFPARFPAVSELRKIAVTAFDGPDGQDFASALETELVAATFDGQRYFSVVDSGDRQRRADPERAAAYGRSIGVQAVMFGSVQAQFSDAAFQQSESQCAVRDGNKCVKYVQVPINCMRRTLDMVAMPRIVAVASGRVVYAVERRSTKQLAWCEPNSQPQSDLTFVTVARAELVRDIRRDISPYNAAVSATLKTDAGGLAGQAKQDFTTAVKLASTSMIEACKLWAKVDQSSPSHAATIFDLGVCAESSGNYSVALVRFRAAQTLKPDKQTVEAIQNTEQLQGAQGMLGQQAAARATTAETERQHAAAELRAAAARDRQTAQEKQVALGRQKAAVAAQRNAVAAKYGAGAADAIIAGQIKAGMTPTQVQAARGKPTSILKISATEEMWRYGAQKVIFVGGRVSLVK